MAALEASVGGPGPSWGRKVVQAQAKGLKSFLGRSWAGVSRSWVALGSILAALGRSWAALGRSWAALGTTCENHSKIDAKNDRFGPPKSLPK